MRQYKRTGALDSRYDRVIPIARCRYIERTVSGKDVVNYPRNNPDRPDGLWEWRVLPGVTPPPQYATSNITWIKPDGTSYTLTRLYGGELRQVDASNNFSRPVIVRYLNA
jgi:hypothetical protein